jgi:hypothetical protein
MGMVGLVAARAHDLTSKYLPYLGYFPTPTHHLRGIGFIELQQSNHPFHSTSKDKAIQVSPMIQID